jgi:type I restriction enzyme, S subunit
MSEWKTYKLGDLVDPKRGITYGVVQPGEFLKDEGVPILKVNNLTGRKYSLEDAFRISVEVESKYERSRLIGNEILVSLVGSLGYIYKVRKELIGWNVVRAIGVLPIKEEFDKDWIYWFMKSPDIQKEFQSQATTTVQATLNLKELREIEIKYPETKIREIITSSLTSLDDKIELNLQMNQTLEAMAQALFKEWFVNFNLPTGQAGFPNFDGELENGLPQGWSYKSIEDLGKVVTGNTPSSKNPEYFGEVTPFVTPTDFKNFGKLIIGANRYLSTDGRIAMKTRLLPKHSIIVTCIGSDMGKIAINSIECVTNQQINSIIPNDKNIVDYLYYDLVYKYEYLRNIATGGSTMPIINKSRFEEIEILIPNSDVLSNFQVLMDSFNFKIEENIRQIQTLTQTRDTLLPKLMTGEIEIKN